MKIRKGFVSNSSSSSFICDICGHHEEGYDMSASEAGFLSCEEGHQFCQDHFSISTVTDDAIKAYIAGVNQKYCSEEFLEMELADQIAAVREALPNDLEGLTGDYDFPSEFCPLCTLDKITDSDLIVYILAENNGSRAAIESKMRERFGNLEEFNKYKKEVAGSIK